MFTITGFNVLLKKSTDCGYDNFGTNLLEEKSVLTMKLIIIILIILRSFNDIC